jgi:hypothetical protein
MKIRTILAAAAVPATLAAALLGTVGQASASVAAPAALTAAVVKVAPATVTANAHRQQVVDTTWGGNAGPATKDTSNGPQWAWDNLENKITATQTVAATQTAPGTWHVTVDVTGSYAAFASPNDGTAWKGNGPIKGTIAFDVTSSHTPDAHNVNGNLPDGTGFTAMLKQFFGDSGAQVVGGHYTFTYGTPDGVYTQEG